MNTISGIGYNNLYNINNTGINFGSKKKFEHSEEVQEIMHDFYSANSKHINDGSSVDLMDYTIPIIMASNAVTLASSIPNQDPLTTSLAILGTTALAGLNLNQRKNVVNAAARLSDELAKNGISQEEMYKALKEVSVNNRQLPFCYIGDKKINTIISKSIQGLDDKSSNK